MVLLLPRIRRNIELLRQQIRRGVRFGKKRLCLGIVDAIDEPKHALSDAYLLYEKGLKDEAISTLKAAPEKAEALRRRWLAEGAPEVVTSEDIGFIRSSFNSVISYMEQNIEPTEFEDLVYDIDAELYDRMFQKFHQCMTLEP